MLYKKFLAVWNFPNLEILRATKPENKPQRTTEGGDIHPKTESQGPTKGENLFKYPYNPLKRNKPYYPLSLKR